MKTITTAAVVLCWLGSGLAFAQNAPTDAQIKQELQSQGYSNVKIGEHERDHVDVTAMKDGKTQKLEVDTKTGQISPDTDND